MSKHKKVIAIIPARGGSKRIPRKNLLPLNGEPLVSYTIRHALAARSVQAVYVSTDDPQIAGIAGGLGARVVQRPASLATDRATSESTLLHVLDERNRLGLEDPELVVFLQCTSPVRRPNDIDRAIKKLHSSKSDSLFSACADRHLLWVKEGKKLKPLNYDYCRRRREQDMGMQLKENGSIYLFKPWVLREHRNRLGGKIAVYEMDEGSSFQLDTPDQVPFFEWLLTRQEGMSRPRWSRPINLIVFDFDGVMTDNRVSVSEDGRESVLCNRSDGLGIERLRKAGMRMMVLSKEKNRVVGARCRKLRIPCYQGVEDKAAFLKRYARRYRLNVLNAVYVGNDVNDVGCMKMVGMPVAVADAHPSALACARWVLCSRGGHGVVRELSDFILRRTKPGFSEVW